MKIRDEQLEAFTEDRTAKFEQYMVDHLRRWIPDQCAELGQEEVRKRIRNGIDRAAMHDIYGQRDLARFIDLTFVLGPRFVQGPEHPWARRILEDKRVTPTEKVDRLCDEANRRARRH